MSRTLNGQNFIKGKPKKTRQGQGAHSKPKGDRKKLVGQGK